MAAFALILFGVFVSVICLRLMYGAAFWIDYYERRLCKIEEDLTDVPVFRVLPATLMVKQHGKAVKRRNRHPSTRGAILLLSIGFVVLWSVLLVVVGIPMMLAVSKSL
jgi:hypothetical protein